MEYSWNKLMRVLKTSVLFLPLGMSGESNLKKTTVYKYKKNRVLLNLIAYGKNSGMQ